MKARDLRDMTDDQLEAALHDRRQELFNLRFQAAMGALENTARLKLAKREIARILTVRNDRGDTKSAQTGPAEAQMRSAQMRSATS